MNRGVNRVTLIGNLGNEPEIRYMPNGTAVANLSVATTESWKDQQGQVQERTEWHKVVLYRRLAEIAGEHLHKGDMVYLEGKNHTRKWQDQQGTDKYTTEVVCDQMQMLGQRPQAQNQQSSTPQNPSTSKSQSHQVPAKLASVPQTPPLQNGTGHGFSEPNFGEEDERIPF